MIRRYRWNGNFTVAEINNKGLPPTKNATVLHTTGSITDIEILPDPVDATAQEDLDEYMASIGWFFVEADPSDLDCCVLASFNAADAILTDASPAVAVVRNERQMLSYAESGTTVAYFTGVLPIEYNTSEELRVKLWWVAATATSGSTRWSVAFEKLIPNGPINVDSESFAANQASNDPTNGTNGFINVVSLAFDNAEADGLQPGNAFRLRVQRQGNAGGDDMSGEAQLMRVSMLQ